MNRAWAYVDEITTLTDDITDDLVRFMCTGAQHLCEATRAGIFLITSWTARKG
ncbi:hypothetical protein AB0K89_11430 [Streptomyces cinnamoneus]|uniref:hypothetical protein n=1 Tax=Streptomyces cinnamoneus TaxID=53446 RepID=UPI00344584BF